MADSITAMGSAPLYFPLSPNWASDPSGSLVIARDYVGFPGTAHTLQATTAYVPREFTLSFMIDNKDDEYSFLDFIHTVKGKAKRFWIEHPSKAFDLYSEVPSGATAIIVEPNGFEKVAQGNERIFFAMKNGDLVVRKVTAAAYIIATDTLSLTVDSATDRVIGLNDFWLIGRFLLCRLAEDGISQAMRSLNVTTYQIKFVEVPMEYDEEEAS